MCQNLQGTNNINIKLYILKAKCNYWLIQSYTFFPQSATIIQLGMPIYKYITIWLEKKFNAFKNIVPFSSWLIDMLFSLLYRNLFSSGAHI